MGERRRRVDPSGLGVLEGYAHGPGATARMSAAAMERVAAARGVVVVEGVSDLIAVETLAGRLGRDLASEGVVVLPMGGAQAVTRVLLELTARGVRVLGGLCDVGEERYVWRGLEAAGLGAPACRSEASELGFFVCVADLEHELIRAVSPSQVERLLESQGDLAAFRTMQRQPGWCEADREAQLHRWIRAGARRSLRYARLLTEAFDLGRAPLPLVGLIEHTQAADG